MTLLPDNGLVGFYLSQPRSSTIPAANRVFSLCHAYQGMCSFEFITSK